MHSILYAQSTPPDANHATVTCHPGLATWGELLMTGAGDRHEVPPGAPEGSSKGGTPRGRAGYRSAVSKPPAMAPSWDSFMSSLNSLSWER